ncbi:capsid protein, partial [[Clostridium] innocuum]|nr:capsid protein [[Clostridium] innocuum]
EVINCVIKAFDTYTKNSSGNDVDVTVNFGEYASPSFEATVETVAKARPGKVIMSVEASVDEMYGDSKDEEWKAEEIKRLRIENGVMETQEPVISEFDDLGGATPTPDDYPQDE